MFCLLATPKHERESYYMSKTDDVLLELNREVAVYLSSIPQFKCENKVYRLIDNYVAEPQMRCAVCGEYPLFEVSVVESDDGSTRLHLGDSCIDNLTSQGVSDWFKSYRRKRDCVLANRKYVDQLSQLLDANDKKELSFEITSVDIKKIRGILAQIYSGQNPPSSQMDIADNFLNRKAPE
jgi:hypothetical protein